MGRVFRNVFSLFILWCLCQLLWVISWSDLCAQLLQGFSSHPTAPFTISNVSASRQIRYFSRRGCGSWWVASSKRSHRWSLMFRLNRESFYLSSARLTPEWTIPYRWPGTNHPTNMQKLNLTNLRAKQKRNNSISSLKDEWWKYSPKLMLFFGATLNTLLKVKKMSERSMKLSDTVQLK